MKASTYFVAMVLSLVAACRPAPPTHQAGPQAVRVVASRSGPIVETAGYLADVAAVRQVRVLAQVPGVIAALPAEEGDAVSAGAPLARIAAPDLVARLERTRSEHERAQAERDFACRHSQTDRRLAEAGDLPPEALDASEKNCSAANHAVDAAASAEAEVSAVVDRSAERAPFDGRVLDRLVDVGQTVMPGTPLALFGSQERELLLRVPRGERVRPGAVVLFDGGAARVDRIGGLAKGPGRLIDTWAQPTEGALPEIGAALPVELVVGSVDDATSVPVEALGRSSEGPFVLLLDGDRVRRAPVTPGLRQDGWVAVEPPLAAGARVVTTDVQGIDPSRPVFAVEVTP